MTFNLESQINYDEELHAKAGKVELANDTLEGDGKTLLRLMYWVLYTTEGRTFLDDHKHLDQETQELIQTDRDALSAKFAEYQVTSEPLVNAIIDAHVAATKWVLSRQAHNDLAQKQAEFVYLQKMSFVTWTLFENFKSHEFSLLW